MSSSSHKADKDDGESATAALRSGEPAGISSIRLNQAEIFTNNAHVSSSADHAGMQGDGLVGMQEESTCRARTLQRKCPLCQRHPLLFALCCLLCAALRYSRDKVVAVHSREGRKQALTCTYSTQPNTMPSFKRDASDNYVDKEGRPIQRGLTHLYRDSSGRELRQRVSDAGKRVVGENRKSRAGKRVVGENQESRAGKWVVGVNRESSAGKRLVGVNRESRAAHSDEELLGLGAKLVSEPGFAASVTPTQKKALRAAVSRGLIVDAAQREAVGSMPRARKRTSRSTTASTAIRRVVRAMPAIAVGQPLVVIKLEPR